VGVPDGKPAVGPLDQQQLGADLDGLASALAVLKREETP
jgi:hypothetical protein